MKRFEGPARVVISGMIATCRYILWSDAERDTWGGTLHMSVRSTTALIAKSPESSIELNSSEWAYPFACFPLESDDGSLEITGIGPVPLELS